MEHDEMIPSPEYNVYGLTIRWPETVTPPGWLTQAADGCCELTQVDGYRRFQRYKLTPEQLNELAEARAGGVNWVAETGRGQ